MKKNYYKKSLRKKLGILGALLLLWLMLQGAVADTTPIYDASSLFTSRDLTQEADLSAAETITVSDGTDVHITQEGVYILTGTAQNTTVYVEADKTEKVQLVLNGLTLQNVSAPCISVLTVDKVFITTSADSTLSVTGSLSSGEGTVYSKADLVLNGTATLTIASVQSGVTCKDDLKITGGTYVITAATKCLDANDSIRIADGTFTLNAGTDGLHAENNEDDTLGYIYIGNGTFRIQAGDDGIHGESVAQIDDGAFTIVAAEGIEGTYIQINGGDITIQASDDGINSSQKSSAWRATIEINGGTITVTMGSGDTDGIDSNGDIIVNGGIISVNGNSTFDYDGSAQFNGGTIYVNGQQVTSIPNQMMGGGRGGKQNFGDRGR